MFKFEVAPTFSREVEIFVPIDGGHRRDTCNPVYRVIDVEEQETFDLTTVKGSTAFLKRVLVKIPDITDADDQPLPWSDQLRDQVIAQPHTRKPLGDGYFSGVNKAREGN